MPGKRNLSTYRKVCFRPEVVACPHCGTRLKRSHNAWRKGVQTLRGNLLATSYAYKCPNPSCPKPALYRSAEAERLSVKHRTYGLDVLVDIGYQRHTEKRSLPEIAASLRSKGIQVSERECYELLHVFEELLATRPMTLDPDFYDAAAANGGIILAIDGVQPENGNSTLYVLQDALTTRVLHADSLENSSSDNLAKLIEGVKSLGIPILGVISDHQHSIRLAVEKALPGVPHQFCQFHVLRNACQPITDFDRNLKKETRKVIRGLNPIEQRLQERTDEAAKVVMSACLMLRCLLVSPGTVVLNWGGLLVFERMKALDEVVQKLLARKPDPDLARLAKLTARWTLVLPLYERVARLAAYAKELSSIFDSQDTAAAVEQNLRAFVERVKAVAGEDAEALQVMVKILESHWSGLFHCYRDPRIPRTDNGLEITIRRVKMSYRRMSGRKSWDGFIVGYGRSVFLLPPDASREALLEWAEEVDRKAFEARWQEFESRRGRLRVMRAAAKDFGGALGELEKAWAA